MTSPNSPIESLNSPENAGPIMFRSFLPTHIGNLFKFSVEKSSAFLASVFTPHGEIRARAKDPVIRPPFSGFLMKIRLILYGLFGLSISISISASLVCGGLVVIDGLVRYFSSHTRPTFPKTWLGRFILGYFLWGLFVSLMRNSMPFDGLLSFQSSFLLVLVFGTVSDGDEIKAMLKGFWGASVFIGLWAIVQWSTGVNNPHISRPDTPFFNSLNDSQLRYLGLWVGRAIGTRSHPLTYAESFVVPFFISWIGLMLSFQQSKKMNWWHFLGLWSFSSGLWLAQGRGVWLALASGIVVSLFFFKKRVAIGSFFAAAVIFSGVFVLSPSMQNRFLSIFSSSHGSSGDQVSKQIRYVLWSQSVDSFLERPLAGTGLKGARLTFFDPLTKKQVTWSESHNIYLQALVELGVVGAVLLIFIFGSGFWIAHRSQFPLKAYVVSMLVAFMAMGLTESWINDKEIAIIFWTMLGCFLRFRELDA